MDKKPTIYVGVDMAFQTIEAFPEFPEPEACSLYSPPLIVCVLLFSKHKGKLRKIFHIWKDKATTGSKKGQVNL